MKKVISLVLCVVMVASLFVINVSAAVPIQKKMKAEEEELKKGKRGK